MNLINRSVFQMNSLKKPYLISTLVFSYAICAGQITNALTDKSKQLTFKKVDTMAVMTAKSKTRSHRDFNVSKEAIQNSQHRIYPDQHPSKLKLSGALQSYNNSNSTDENQLEKSLILSSEVASFHPCVEDDSPLGLCFRIKL